MFAFEVTDEAAATRAPARYGDAAAQSPDYGEHKTAGQVVHEFTREL